MDVVGAKGDCKITGLPEVYTPGIVRPLPARAARYESYDDYDDNVIVSSRATGQTYSVSYSSSCNGGHLNFNAGSLQGATGFCQSHGWSTVGSTFTRTWTAPVSISGDIQVRLACGDNSGCPLEVTTYIISKPGMCPHCRHT